MAFDVERCTLARNQDIHHPNDILLLSWWIHFRKQSFHNYFHDSLDFHRVFLIQSWAQILHRHQEVFWCIWWFYMESEIEWTYHPLRKTMLERSVCDESPRLWTSDHIIVYGSSFENSFSFPTLFDHSLWNNVSDLVKTFLRQWSLNPTFSRLVE